MILTVDIGNTNTNIGTFQGKRLTSHFCIDNRSLIQQKNTLPLNSSILNRAENILIASVNPKTESTFLKLLHKKNVKRALKIGSEIKIKMPILVENPEKVGIDRLLNSLAAFRRTKMSTIVIDFGTAITIDIVSKRGEFLGGVILPGIKTSAHALNKQTALLGEIDIKKPARIIGKNTEEAICSGIYIGTVGSVIHLIKEIRKELRGIKYIIATGGDAGRFKAEIPQIDKYIRHLTLEGMRTAFSENFSL